MSTHAIPAIHSNASGFTASAAACGFEQELLHAGEMQSNLLPPTTPLVAQIDLAARCLPARTLAGDFYDFFRYQKKSISAGALADVSGKGAPAAIYAALATGVLRSMDHMELGPAEMLRSVNATLMKRPVRARFVSMIYTTWDDHDRSLRIANSGLPQPIWIHRGKLRAVEVTGIPLGMFADAEYQELTMPCAPGDVIVFFTDGVTEATNALGEEFGRPRLEHLLAENSQKSSQNILDAIFDSLRAHSAGADIFDDATAVVIRT